MPSLREHVEARKAQTVLSNVDSATFQMALQRTYEAVADGVWAGRTPSDDEFVAVVCDKLEMHGRLTEDEYKQFRLLRSEDRKSVV